MNQGLSILRNNHPSRWLHPQSSRRVAMVSRQPARRPDTGPVPRVYCDPRMPEGWTAVSD